MKTRRVPMLAVAGALLGAPGIAAAQQNVYHAKPGGTVGCKDSDDLGQAKTDHAIRPDLPLKEGCSSTDSNVAWKFIRMEPGYRVALMRLIDPASERAVALYFMADDMIDSSWHSPHAPPDVVAPAGSYAAGPTPKLNPCAGISPDAVVATFNIHGARLGGPSGPNLQAVGASGLQSTTAGFGPGHVGVCTVYLTITWEGGGYVGTQYDVELQSDGTIWLWQLAEFGH